MSAAKDSPSEPPGSVPRPGFSVTPPPAALPGFDPSDSPLVPGGRKGSPEPVPADASLQGLKSPGAAPQRRVMLRVRREGWVARREQARARFRTLSVNPSAAPDRFLRGLRERGGLLERSRSNAVRPRFNLRGHGGK